MAYKAYDNIISTQHPNSTQLCPNRWIPAAVFFLVSPREELQSCKASLESCAQQVGGTQGLGTSGLGAGMLTETFRQLTPTARAKNTPQPLCRMPILRFLFEVVAIVRKPRDASQEAKHPEMGMARFATAFCPVDIILFRAWPQNWPKHG